MGSTRKPVLRVTASGTLVTGTLVTGTLVTGALATGASRVAGALLV
jgi:hypothetical protein